jgi:hypothetical protein
MPPKTRKRKPSATGESSEFLHITLAKSQTESNHTEDVAPKKAARAPRKPTTGTAKQGRGKNAANGAAEGSVVVDLHLAAVFGY